MSGMRFEFVTAGRILFGVGTQREAGSIAASLGQRALLVTTPDAERAAPLITLLEKHGVAHVPFTVQGEPTIEVVQAGTQLAQGCDLVIAFGGGSVIDTGKAVAALLRNGGDLYDYLEVIGRGQPLKNPSAPMIAIPTTAGTGSEVTRNAVLASPEHRVKVSLRSPHMLPTVALVDPELTYSLPPQITAYTGLDALTQVIEPLVSVKANPMTDALCREAISRAAQSLLTAYQHGDDAAAREDMALASLFGGLALANAGLGAVHGFAGPLGGMFDAPHGAICAALLPYVMATNIAALRERQPDGEGLRRYGEVARLLTRNPSAAAEDGAAWVATLCQQMNIPLLSSYGLEKGDFAVLIEKSAAASSMKGNPIALTPDEMQTILERAL